MKGVCGWLGSVADGLEVIRSMTGGVSGELVGKLGAVAGCSRSSTASIRGVLSAISGHPKFQDAALKNLAEREGAASALIHAYLDQDESVFKSISGSFSAAILDESKGLALLAVDRAGIGSMNFHHSGGCLVFGSSLDSIVRHPAVHAEIAPQAIYDYIYFHMIPGPETIYKNHHKLLPGQYVVFRNGHVDVRTYWTMHFDEEKSRPFEELKAEFLEILRTSVLDAAQGAETGAFLSGGTDSSTIAGMLGLATGRIARTYSIGFDEEGYDEMAYARIAARRFGTDHHEYYVTPENVASSIPRIAASYDQPFGNSSAVPTYYCAKLAKEDGIGRLLGGDGGDELFGGNTRYAKQRLFSFYTDLPGTLRKGLIEPIAFGLPGLIPPVRKLRSYIEQASVPMPRRLETYNLLVRLGSANVFTPGFLGQVDPGNPVRLLDAVYDGAQAGTLINRMLALDLKFTLADNDLPKVTQTCFLAGVDIAFPLLSDEMIAFSSRLDPELKLKGLKLRYFFKEALRGFLPEEIIAKQKHGFGLPFGEWMRTNRSLQEIGQDSMDSLKGRDIVRPEFIDDLLKLHSEAHSGYYGTMVWVLMMLEQWFRQHVDSAQIRDIPVGGFFES